MKKLLLSLCLIFLFSSFCFAGSMGTSATDASVIITNARYYLNEPTAVLNLK
jgi:hypothetical protein